MRFFVVSIWISIYAMIYRVFPGFIGFDWVLPSFFL